MALALASTVYAFVMSQGSLAAMMPFQALVISVPAIAMLFGRRGSMRLSELVIWMVLAALLSLSVLVNAAQYSSGPTSLSFAVTHLAGFVALLFTAQWTAHNLRPQLVFRNVSLLLSPLFAGAVVVGLVGGGFLLRQAPLGLHPNWWGELAICFMAGALIVPCRVCRIGLMAMAAGLLVLVQSRGAILAVSVGAFLYMLASIGALRVRRSHAIVVLLVLLICLAFLATSPTALRASQDFLLENVLILNDPNRGIGSGASRRVEGWHQAVDAFSDHLLLGRGLDTLPEVHNGFLRIASENGILVLMVIVILILRAMYESLLQANPWRFAIIGAYLTYAMTFPRMFNMNLTATLFFVCLFSWRRQGHPQESEHDSRADGINWSALPGSGG